MNEFPAMKKYFGETAAIYDATRMRKATTQKDQATVENYLAKVPPGSSVLDIPAGTGRFIRFCLSRGLLYTGVDISPDMLEVARSKIPAVPTNVDLRVADARALPFANDSFDYAIVVKFIKWLPGVDDLTFVLREIGRVTRKEMFVQIRTVQSSRPSRATRVARLLGHLPFMGAIARRLAADARGGNYSEQELSYAISTSGLRIRSVVPAQRPSKKKPTSDTRPRTRFYVLCKDE